jgi:aldose 1-epimerase
LNAAFEMERVRIASTSIAVEILPYGATIAKIEAPDRAGERANVVLGFPDVEGYVAHPHVCCVIGRYANRIADAAFTLDGKRYELPANNGPNTLHGGPQGFDKAVWDVAEAGDNTVRLTHTSPDGDQGFPGRMDVEVRYTAEEDALRIDYAAVSDHDTVVNLTNHTYFNLRGAESGEVADQALQIFASRYTPVDSALIPTGEFASVAATPLDFRQPRPITTYHYDNNFVLDRTENRLGRAAIAGDPISGRMLEVLTTEPGLQLYTGNPRGFALETQHFPDSPHHPHFPSTVLRAGERFESTTILRFFTS